MTLPISCWPKRAKQAYHKAASQRFRERAAEAKGLPPPKRKRGPCFALPFREWPIEKRRAYMREAQHRHYQRRRFQTTKLPKDLT